MNSAEPLYRVGAGIASVTDPAMGLAMQGMADPSQKTKGVESLLYSRAFALWEKRSQRGIAIAVVDIWACTEAVRTEVVKRLRLRFQTFYTEDNVLISGTHTHSGPGGFSKSLLYEQVTGGFDPHTFECIVSGIVESIEKAHLNLEPGRVYICRDRLPNCGRQRSRAAYLNNPLHERIQYKSDADEEMLLLKFVSVDSAGNERPIGSINWQAIHPTDRGQGTALVNGDNKGYAAHLFEEWMRVQRGETTKSYQPFLAAFANANCGDISGNVEFNAIPDGMSDAAHMQLHGEKLFAKAVDLFERADVELRGQIDYRHTRVDMSKVVIEDKPNQRTWPAALGLSFAAGSTEDSIPKVKVAGAVIPVPAVKEGAIAGKLSLYEKLIQKIVQIALRFTFGRPSFSQSLTQQSFTEGQWPKPIILSAGLINPPIVNSVLPLQLIQIGDLAITAVPGELTTMAGRRLRKTLLSELKEAGIQYVALATYANDYSLYITTKEEYEKQHYEGAATLYGPYTLAAYQQEFSRLAKALILNKPVNSRLSKQKGIIYISDRITIRNISSKTAKVKVLRCNRMLFVSQIKTIAAPPHSDFAYYLPKDVGEVSVVINSSQILKPVTRHHLITIDQRGCGHLSSYTPKKQKAIHTVL